MKRNRVCHHEEQLGQQDYSMRAEIAHVPRAQQATAGFKESLDAMKRTDAYRSSQPDSMEGQWEGKCQNVRIPDVPLTGDYRNQWDPHRLLQHQTQS